jgi:hypothetical protein
LKRDTPLSQRWAAAERIGFAVCLTAIVLLGAGAEFATFARSDTAFLLDAAERVLDGAQLYVDVVEINPPLIVALNLPAVVLARAIGVSDIAVYRTLVTISVLCALAFADWSLRRALAPGSERLRRRLVLVLAFALFLAPGNDFGQREHLLMALALPYVLLVVARLSGRAAPPGPALAAGVLAGVGLALKPHFLLLWVAIEGFAAWRLRTMRPAPETLGIAGFLAMYAAAVATLTPQYFDIVRLLGSAYGGFGRDPFVHVLITAPGTTVCYLAVLAAVALRRESKHRMLWTVLLVAMVGSFLAGAAQQKGWDYHFYPSRVFATVLLALAVLDVRRPLARAVQQVYAAAAFAALAVSLLLSVEQGIIRVRHRDAAREAEQRQLDELVAAVRRHLPQGGSLYALSYTIGSSFPLVNYSGARWASRFPHLWIIEAVYQEQLHATRPLRFHTPAEMGRAERYLNDAVYEDLTRYRPDVLMVLKHARDTVGNSLRRVDYLAYFGRDPRIAGALSGYRLAEEVGQYLFYVRAASAGQSGEPPRSAPGRYDVVRAKDSAGGWGLLAADHAFLRNVCLFLLAFGAWRLERSRVRRRVIPG